MNIVNMFEEVREGMKKTMELNERKDILYEEIIKQKDERIASLEKEVSLLQEINRILKEILASAGINV